MIRAGYGIFYGGEENQGGNPNRGEGIPFNETVNMVRTAGVVSSFLGIIGSQLHRLPVTCPAGSPAGSRPVRSR